MSILHGKNALLVSDDAESFADLTKLLEAHQVHCLSLQCNLVTPEMVKEHGVDIIFLSHMCKDDVCCGLLSLLTSHDSSRTKPIVVLVDGSEKQIGDALMRGAADYITAHENEASVLKKVKMILGQPDTLSSPQIFDVPPDFAPTTKTDIRVGVVEDDPLLRNLLATRLEASSFPHTFLPNGDEAVQKLRAFKPQVIILDLMLPGKSGFEILEEIKVDSELKHTPVIIFSNRDSQDDRQRVARLGIDRFFVKALTDLSVLVKTIEELA